jgi:hypothetical protein
MEETKDILENPVQNTEDADESEGSDSKYRGRKFSDVLDLVDENLSSPDFCTSRFAVVVLVILFNIYFLFFGALFVDTMRGEL